jgi:hypothetical protein
VNTAIQDFACKLASQGATKATKHFPADLVRADLSKSEAKGSQTLLAELVQVLGSHGIVPAQGNGYAIAQTEERATHESPDEAARRS